MSKKTKNNKKQKPLKLVIAVVLVLASSAGVTAKVWGCTVPAYQFSYENQIFDRMDGDTMVLKSPHQGGYSAQPFPKFVHADKAEVCTSHGHKTSLSKLKSGTKIRIGSNQDKHQDLTDSIQDYLQPAYVQVMKQ